MSPSLEYLERCAAETGFQVSPLEKVVRLGEMAADVARHPFLGSVLALKGGTALNLCFEAPRRLSVDLDFNYIGQVEREKMLDDRPRVEAAVADLARRRGYRVQQSADAFAGRKLYLRYRSTLGPEERIELDLNYLFRVPLGEPEMRPVWQPGELDRPRVRVVGIIELLAGKLLALLDRCAARDAWDVANLPAPATKELKSRRFRARFIALSAILVHPLSNYRRQRIESLLTERAVVEQLRPMLVADETPGAKDLIERAWAVVGPLLTLEANEKAYLAAVQAGVLRAEMLFPGEPAEAARIASHPAILWKIENVRTRRELQGREVGRAGPNDGPPEG